MSETVRPELVDAIMRRVGVLRGAVLSDIDRLKLEIDALEKKRDEMSALKSGPGNV